MAFGWSAATWYAITAAVAVVGTGVAANSAKDQRVATNKANDQNRANALKTQADAARAEGRANARSPDSAAMMAANATAAKAGQSGTMLTGPTGIDPTQLTLGKNTLLGG